jgi:signal transduction histidine kinase/CheY-like chemotaxis protein
MSAIFDTSAVSSSLDANLAAAVEPIERGSRFERIVVALSSSEGEDGRPRRALLIAAFSMVALFQLACLVEPQWRAQLEGLPNVPTAVPPILSFADAALTVLALGLSSLLPIGRRWRFWIVGYWTGFIAIRTAICIFADQDEPLVLALFVVVLSSATFVPWTLGWETIVAAMCMVAFTIASFVGVIEFTDVERWIILAVAAAFGLSFCALKETYLRQHRLNTALCLGEEKLRNEVAERERDIAARKKIEIELIAAREAALTASKAKTEFLSSMSHEIRTPMNAVLGMAELLSETELTTEQRRYLDVMVANGNSLLDLINSVLDLARIESGRMQIEKTEFDLVELIDQTISTFGVRAHGKGLELMARLAPGVPQYLVGDPLRVRQVLVNLIGNAIKFTEIGQILLEVFPEGADEGLLCFAVSDTGIGIKADKVETIFHSFTQEDSSTTRRFGGTGLGLAIAQRLVSLMGGRIWVESDAGKGSKFSFTCPFGLAARVIAPAADVVLSLNGYRVLVVDDNQINRMIVREMIASCGAEMAEAGSGLDALAAIREASVGGNAFHIVLLDMKMPEMDGLEVARRIRGEHLPIEPIILMLSSDDLKPQISGLRAMGLDAYLVKPVIRKELFDAIRRVIKDANRANGRLIPDRPHAAAPAQHGPGQIRGKILVVDDSPDNRMLVGAYLRREPYDLDFAVDGKEAVEKFKQGDYVLVLMDILMPEMDGLTATQTIRKWEHECQRRATPVVALTASALEVDVKRSFEAGCTAHVSKPVKKSVLLETVRNFTVARATSDPPTDQISAG